MPNKGKSKSEAARQRANEYQRRYRRLHPDKCQAWQNNYILRRAKRLQNEQAKRPGGEGGDA